MSTSNIKTGTLAVRIDPSNLNHHLWNNNGTWWCHFTVHLADHTKARVRKSLFTKEIARARKLRDSLLTGVGRWGGAQVGNEERYDLAA